MAATVYVKDIGEALPYYESGATSCDDVTIADSTGSLQAALTAAGQNGTLNICPGTYSGAEINADRGIRTALTGQTIQGTTGIAGDVILSSPMTDTAGVPYKAPIAVLTAGCTISHLTLTGGQYRGIYVAASNATLNNIVSHTNGDAGGSYGSGFEFAKTSTPLIDNIVCNDCIAYGNENYGFMIWSYVTNVTYNRCVSYRNASLDAVHGFSSSPKATTYTTGWVNDGGTVYHHAHATNSVHIVRNLNPVSVLTENDGATTSVGAGEWDWAADVLYINVEADPEAKNIKVTDDDYGPVTYNDCIAYDNYDSGIIAETGYGGEGHGFAADDGSYGHTYNRCVSYDNDGVGFSINGGNSNVVQNSISYSNDRAGVYGGYGTEFIVYNMTVDGNTLDGIELMGGGSLTVNNTILTNNGDFGIDANVAGTFTENYNLFNGNNADRDDIGTGGNSISGDPLFVNAAGGNFNLKTGSPAIDAGLDLGDAYTYDFNGYRNQDLYGSGWEIGALIYPSRKIHRRISGQGIY